jgi:hypothetical protein
MAYFDLINALLEASRNKDVVYKHIVLDLLSETEPDYADTLDLIDSY